MSGGEESLRLASALGAGIEGPPVAVAKPTMVALTRAIERVLASSLGVGLLRDADETAPPLVVACFQHPAYLEAERERLAAYASLGATTIVGVAGEVSGLPSGVVHLDTAGRVELNGRWILAVFDGAFCAFLSGEDERRLLDGPSLEESRRFLLRWSVEPSEAAGELRQLLAPVRPRLDRRLLARVEGALQRTLDASPAETASFLTTLLHSVVPQLQLPAEADRRDELVERDLFTGLRNRTFLEHYLPAATSSAVQVAALLLDVDDLGALNEREGIAAGDAALGAIAAVLAAERRVGEVLVRYGDDEFLLLAPIEGPQGAVELAERLVIAVRAARLEPPFERETVTVSVGVAVADAAELPFSALRDAVHLAKLLGKNVARLVD